jgi:hypothetical protein
MNDTSLAPAVGHASTEASEYRAFSPAAVGSLICGLLSPVSLVGPLLLIFPVLGVGLAVVALRSIANSQGELVGRRVALAGLALSIVFGTAGPVQSATTAMRLTAAARPIADRFFEFLRHDEPHYAHQLTTVPANRRVLNENLWSYYGGNQANRDDLTKWASQPLMRFLLEQGDQAQVRYYGPGSVSVVGDPQYADLIYAVTHPVASGQQTFFVRVTVERRTLQSGEIFWRITGVEGGYRPPEYDGA